MGVGRTGGWATLHIVPITICCHRVLRGGTRVLVLQCLLICWGSMTIPQSKHSPDPGSAVLGVIGYGQDNDRMVSLPWVACHALMSALYCCLPLLDVGHCGIAIAHSIIDSLVKGGRFGSQLPCPRSGALYGWCWLGRLSW